MDVSPYRTQSHFPCWEGAQNLIFSWNWRVFLGQNWHDVDRCKLIYDIRSPPNQIYTFGKGFEGLKQQWMSLLIAQYPTSCVERVTKIWYFVSNWRAVFGRNDTVFTIMLSYMLPESPLIILIHLMKITNHSISSEYLYLPNIIPIHVLKGCQILISYCLCMDLQSYYLQKWHGVDHT